MTITKTYEVAINELCEYSRLCYERHLVGSDGGNVSIRLPGEKLFAITASGIALRDTDACNILIVDENGKIVEGKAALKPSKEMIFHLDIYRAKPQIGAVVHVHPAFCTLFANGMRSIPAATISAEKKLTQFGIVPKTEPGSPAIGREMKKLFSVSENTCGVILMERHGIASLHYSLREAFYQAELAEETSKIAFYESIFPDKT